MGRSNGAAKTSAITETSAIVSIEALLRAHEEDVAQAARDAQLAHERAETERAAKVRRAAEEAEAARKSAEAEAEAKRIAAERHAAEMSALKHAAIEKARVEAEREAERARRAAELEHERSLLAMKHDAGKKRLKRGIVAIVALLAIAIVGGGAAIHTQHERELAAEHQAAELAGKVDDLKKSITGLQDEKAKANDPAKIAELQRRIDAQKAEIDRLKPAASPTARNTARSPSTSPASTATAPRGEKKPCFCLEGDPTCDTTSCQIIRKH